MKSSYLAALLTSTAILSGCSMGNLDDVKENAEKTFAESGFEIVGYSGYQLGLNPWPGYGGAKVWYTIQKNNGVTYEASLIKWGDEYHLYNLSAIDAIKP